MEEELTKATEALRQIAQRREARRRAARFRPDGKLAPTASRNRFIADATLVREPVPDGGGAEFWITYTPGREEFLSLRSNPALAGIADKFLDPDALNGYVAWPKRGAPTLPRSTRNIVQYIPVHGGITYALKDAYAAVWGFDTMHAGSENEPRADRDWIRANCWVLYRGLLLAAKLWPKFKRASQPKRAEIAQQLLDLVEEQQLKDKLGFEAMIGMLFGRIG